MSTTTIEITTETGHEITATLSDDGERISIYQGGALAGTGRVDVGALAREAAEAGDHEMVALCDRAARGDKAALRACARARAAALAMETAS